MKKIAVLGSTGSIGTQALNIIEAHPQQLQVAALAAGKGNLAVLTEQIKAFNPELVCVPDSEAVAEVKQALGSHRPPEFVTGNDGLIAVATHPAADTLITGVVGFLGLLPTAAAIRKGKKIALANKETLVAAGNVIMPLAREHGSDIIPVDSEHSAIFQSLAGHSAKDIRQILLTGSGGPFRTWSADAMARATIDDALNHPNWSMGPKITVDSATLMNKGLEIIEARWLFDIPSQQIKVLIHPQSILHSAVEFVDGSIIGQLGLPDMRLPIHYALFWPDRSESVQVPRLDLVKLKSLTFEDPDLERFPCLALAREVSNSDSTLPCALNAANEIAVDSFLKGRIRFAEIASSIERVLERHRPINTPSLEDILEADRSTRKEAEVLVGSLTKQSR